MPQTFLESLARQVLAGDLTLPKALKQAVSGDTLAHFDDANIDRMDDHIRDLAEQNLSKATVLALLNQQIARKKGGRPIQGHCHGTLAWLYKKQEKFELALHRYRKALDTFKPTRENAEIVVHIRLDVGEIQERRGELGAAEAEFKTACKVARRLTHVRTRARYKSDAYNGLGRVYLDLERVDDALAAFERALTISKKHADQRNQETALGNLGLVNRFLGRLDKAAHYHRQAIKFSKKTAHRIGLGRHLDNLGNAWRELNRFDQAEACYRQAIKIAEQLDDHQGHQKRLGNLGNLYQDKAKREIEHRETLLGQAERCHRAALDIAQSRGGLRGQGNHWNNLGNVYSELGRVDEAQKCYTKALRLIERRDVADTRWRTLYAQGNLYAAQGQDQGAFDLYTSAIEIVETQRYRLKIESRTKFWQERATLYKRMVLCCLRLKKLWSALQYTEQAKTRYLADLLAQRTTPADDTQKTIRAVLQDLPLGMAVVVFNVTEAGTVVFIVVNPGNKTVPPPGDGWQRSPDGFVSARLIQDFNRQTLQSLLVQEKKPGQAGGGYLFDYSDDPDKWQAFTLESVSIEVYRDLLAPVRQELTRLLVKRVIFMPNLGLSLLPLHACYRENGAERNYLLDYFEISYAPSFDVLYHCQRRAKRGRWSDKLGDLLDKLLTIFLGVGPRLFAIANPTHDLAWAGVEVKHIAGLFSKTKILDGDRRAPINPEVVITQAPHFTYLHFACHGKFDLREPLDSYLKITREEKRWLTLETAMKRLKLPHTRLVVMSACETGLVDPADLADEYVGLPAGFMRAGVPSVVSSLWAVPDLSTALLMTRFYENHLRGDPDADPKARRPLPPVEALRRAQIWLREEATARKVAERCKAQVKELRDKNKRVPLPVSQAQNRFARMAREKPDHCPFAHPFYWAAFIVSGSTKNPTSKGEARE